MIQRPATFSWGTAACILVGVCPIFASSPPVLNFVAETVDARFGVSPGNSYNTLLVALPAIDVTLFLAALDHWKQASWGEIGLGRPTSSELLLTVASSLACLKVTVAILLACRHSRLSGTPAPPSALGFDWSRAGILVLATAADGLWEEVVFRGYLISRVEQACGSRLIAGCLSLGASVAAHVPHWGLSRLLWKVPLATFFIVLYLLRRNVTLCWVAHTVTDLGADFLYGAARGLLQSG